jgi:hypothetical protein
MSRVIEVVPYHSRLKFVSFDDAIFAVSDGWLHQFNAQWLSAVQELPPGVLIDATTSHMQLVRTLRPFGRGAPNEVSLTVTDDGSIISAHSTLRTASRPVNGASLIEATAALYHVVCEEEPGDDVLKTFETSDGRERASVPVAFGVQLYRVDGGLVLTEGHGDLVALDLELRELWRVPGKPGLALSAGFGAGVVAVDGVVVRNFGADAMRRNGQLAAFSLTDGLQLWEMKFPAEASISKVGSLLYCASSGRIWVVDAGSGRVLLDDQPVHQGDGHGDVVWSDGERIWYASVHDCSLRALDACGQPLHAAWRLPAGFQFVMSEPVQFARGWTYLRVISDPLAFRGGLAGILCIGPAGDLPDRIAVQSAPPHRVTRVSERGKDRYRVALHSESMEELHRFAAILAKTTAKVRGTGLLPDERRNSAFDGQVEVAVALASLGRDEQEALQRTLDVVSAQVAAEYVKAADGSRIRILLVPLEPGELDGAGVSTKIEPPALERAATAPAATSSAEEDDEAREMMEEALQGAKQEPAWRLGFAAVVLGGAALGDGFAARRERANERLKQLYGEHSGFSQELVFHTGVLLTTPGVARRLWGTDEVDPKTVFEDFKRGVIQLAEWINEGNLSVDEGLAAVRVVREVTAQLPGASGKGVRGALRRLGGKGGKTIPKQAKPVFDAIEVALAEVERQLRKQS